MHFAPRRPPHLSHPVLFPLPPLRNEGGPGSSRGRPSLRPVSPSHLPQCFECRRANHSEWLIGGQAGSHTGSHTGTMRHLRTGTQYASIRHVVRGTITHLSSGTYRQVVYGTWHLRISVTMRHVLTFT